MRHLNTISQFLFICFIPELPDVTAKLIVCVAYNAIRLSDIQRSQLYSSAKVLIDQGYMKVLGNLKNCSRDDVKKLKPF